MTLPTGTKLGRYETRSLIGVGGMGEVYRASDPKIGRDVAIKVLPADFSANKERVARFEQEAQAAGALNHPNIIAVYDVDTQDGMLYVVSELLEGEELRARLDEGPIPLRKVTEYAQQIVAGLSAAHEKGIVHRDLKPENIFITKDDRVKILDFGLAKLREPKTDIHGSEDATRKAMTNPGVVMGTVGYMSPEQVRGQAVDHRSDIFSFGAILYEMLTGRRAFQGDSMVEMMHAILKEDVPESEETEITIPPALDKLMRRCLEKKPDHRFHSAHDLGFALEALSTPTTSSGSNASAIDNIAVVNNSPVNRWKYPAMAVAFLCLVTAGFGLWYFGVLGSASGSSESKVTYQPLTFEKGFIYAARFAPDSRMIVYSADWEGQPRQLYVTSLDNPEYRPLGFPGADLLAISPSGELAILTESQVLLGNPYFRTGTLAKASLTGGASRPELENIQFADFGQNNTMAVARTENGRSTMEFPVGTQATKRTEISTTSDYVVPRISRSGEYLAFFDVSKPRAYPVTILDGTKKPIATSRSFVDWWGLAWRSTSEVWFAAAETAGRDVGIFSLDTAGRQRTIIRFPGSVTLHDISPTGDVLVSIDRNVSAIEIIDGGDSTPKDRSWREMGRIGGISSNDTVMINDTGYSGGSKGSIYVWKPDSTQAVKIADGIGLAFSSDGGKALVLVEGDEPTVSMVPTGPGKPQKLNLGTLAEIKWGGWLPDGRILVQAKKDKNDDPGIFVLSADGDELKPILPPGVSIPEQRERSGFSGISPDGTWLVAADPAGKPVLCTTGTGKCEPIRGMNDTENLAGWSADGSSLLVYERTPGEVEIHRLDPVSGKRSLWRKVKPARSSTSGVYSLFVSARGTIAYGYQEEISKLYLVKGLG